MWGHRFRKAIALLALVPLMQSCQSLDGGSIEKVFTGITSAIVMGPETVDLTWTTNSKCNTYEIYLLSSSASSAIGTAALSPYRVKAPTIVDQQAYTFAVGCASSSGTTGQDIVIDATTWSKFNGVMTSTIDTTGANPILVLGWSYLQNSGTVFQVYAKESVVPGDLTSPVPWQLTRPGPVGSGYTETPVCSTYDQSVRIGQGGNCQPNLKPGVSYNFKVVARYPDGTYSNDIAGNGTTQTVPAAFTPPACVLTQSGIGSEATSSYLFLRCGAATGGGCTNVSVKAYQVNGGTRAVVSDAMSVPGTLRIQPTISPTAANSRTVKGLEIDFTCLSTTPNTVATVRYDNSDSQHREPAMKYGNEGYEAAPVQSYATGQHPSNFGMASAIGDFDCNGKPDIAFGLPNITFNSAPYFNKNAGSGAVKVIYNYVQNANGTYSGTSEQYLTFRDLPGGAGFGRALSVGNINKDVYADFNTASYYSCDDLIVSAPGVNGVSLNGASNGGNFTGAVYVFYGQPQKFPQPFDSAGLAVNSPTCTGNITNEVCSVVRLAPDATSWLKVHPSYSSDSNSNNRAPGIAYNAVGSYGYSAFGYSVSYIRDFNADGYGDIAVGDPYCDWDGDIVNGWLTPTSNTRETIRQVGCVYVYWGGPSGIGNVNMGYTPDGAQVLSSPLAKIYPPFPEGGMHFGWSISGGGDVDSRPPVPVKRNGGNNIILANGNDFIVGAPDFSYTPTYTPPSGGGTFNEDSAEGTNSTQGWIVNETISKVGCVGGAPSCAVDPLVNQGPTAFGDNSTLSPSSKLVPPWNGAWTQSPAAWAGIKGPVYPDSIKQPGLRASTGIAFLYLGRSPISGYGLAVDDGFSKYPNQVSSTLPSSGLSSIEGLLSASARDRTNGSQYLKVATTYDWRVNPVDSFYNCGSRGSPTGDHLNNGTGYYKHNSCFAGRNNFSVIYPALKTTDAAVSRFGTKVQIAGSKDQNAVALYELGSAVGTTSGFASAYTRDGNDLRPLAQGSLHDNVRGTNLWELGIKGINTASPDSGYETYADTSNSTCSGGSCNLYQGFLSRSALTETYNFPTIFTGTIYPAKPRTDINQDGYADVVVGSNSGKLFTYYGNYAADFGYQGNNNSTAPNCSVTRLTAIQAGCGSANTDFGTALPGCGAFGASGNNSGITPYTTYRGYSSAITAGTTSTIVSQYPEVFLPSAGYWARLSNLDDVNETSAGMSIVYSYTAISLDGSGVRNGTKSVAANSCLPYVRSYSSPITAIDSQDMNNDGITDIILGFSSDNGNIGKTVVSTAGTGGIGLSFDTAYTVNSANAKNGFSVSATNWNFMGYTSRRDLFSGASGYNSGSGAVYNYTAANLGTLSTTPNATILEDSNFPNYLRAERSKIIGDVDGNGIADLLVPVRQVSSTGGVYFNGLIYFGSPFGPVTYSFCMSKLGSIKDPSGNSITASDCLGTSGSALANLEGTTIRLPQYLSQPTGVTANWVLSAYPVGDVDKDGNDDMLVMDYSGGTMNLFFGSSSGLVNGTPHVGPMVNHAPQLVSSNSIFMNNYGTVGGSLQPLTAWYGHTDQVYSRSGYNSSDQNYPLVNGDFNGDGYRDLALTFYVAPPGHVNDWDCTGTEILDPLVPLCYNPALRKSSPGGTEGTILILYGSATGYQTPVNGSQIPVDFETNLVMKECPDFYNFTGSSGCKYVYNNNYNLSYLTEAYDTLLYNSGSDSWDVNTNRTACNPSTGSCKGEIIRTPLFYNIGGTGGNWKNMTGGVGFGSMLTVADTNNDGIDDLLVTHNRYNIPGFNGTTMSGNSQLTGNVLGQGIVFIYYGAKGAGLVAPNASMMVGDRALGIKPGDANIIADPNHPPFAIYPIVASAVGGASFYPELESVASTYRQFGINTSAGDFNGDGADDIAVVSNYGQLYIYYGPICQFDNEKVTWQTSYAPANHNIGKPFTGTMAAGECSYYNFNTTLTPATSSNPITVYNVPQKTMYPQMIYVSGTSALNFFGSMLMSKRPVRSVASTTAVAWPGNIDNDPEKTSDLVIGSPAMQDPNVTSPVGTITGLGYVLFGHKDYAVGEMPTTPGLYVGNASYNSALLTKNMGVLTRCNTSCFYHQALILKPHTSDGVTGQFFQYESSLGDLNGDGSGDLIMPTADIHYGADVNKTPVVTGGGFKMEF